VYEWEWVYLRINENESEKSANEFNSWEWLQQLFFYTDKCLCCIWWSSDRWKYDGDNKNNNCPRIKCTKYFFSCNQKLKLIMSLKLKDSSLSRTRDRFCFSENFALKPELPSRSVPSNEKVKVTPAIRSWGFFSFRTIKLVKKQSELVLVCIHLLCSSLKSWNNNWICLRTLMNYILTRVTSTSV